MRDKQLLRLFGNNDSTYDVIEELRVEGIVTTYKLYELLRSDELDLTDGQREEMERFLR